MKLPHFKYHPDPVGSGSVKESNIECLCCGRVRGYIYVGPVYVNIEYRDCICPWCIADGSAHEKLGVFFTDAAGIGGYGSWDDVPINVIEEVAYRTPGFCGWQQEMWWTHCGDAGQFLGRAGCKELEEFGDEAIHATQESIGLDDGQEWNRVFAALDKDGSPTAYIFRCAKCGKLGGYHDCD